MIVLYWPKICDLWVRWCGLWVRAVIQEQIPTEWKVVNEASFFFLFKEFFHYAQYNNSISSTVFRYEAPVKTIQIINTQEKNIWAEWEKITYGNLPSFDFCTGCLETLDDEDVPVSV